MNKPSFYTALENLNEIGDIESVLKEFPYFQTARLLYLKKLQNVEDIHFDNELKKTAIYAGDRKILYYLMLHKAFTKKMVEIDEVISAIPIKKANNLPAIDTKKTTDALPLKEKEINICTDISKEKQENTPSAQPKKEPSPLDRQIIEQAIAYSIEKEVEEITKEEVTTTKIAEPKNEKIENIDISNLSFTEWLKYSSSNKEKIPQKKSLKSIVEKFITIEPKIKPPKTEFFTPASIAKKSVQDNEDFITETLAKIYVNQGNYNKAIKAFKRLSLNYPEKSTYFADQIKSIKDNFKEQ